ncbi:hypothetical protein [Bacillus sp. MUM 13]|uniref:hypothetical protein n=1 Tax=Bacillus sp. MUM 13 TaxID=1678001 RepID=UPI00196AF91A|nr:hypothetical protein [Bacillus sp. MUM 13]
MKKNIFLDIRINIGLIFLIIGLILVISGIISPPTLKSLHGLNINLIWGAVTAVIGVIFLLLYVKRPNID